VCCLWHAPPAARPTDSQTDRRILAPAAAHPAVGRVDGAMRSALAPLQLIFVRLHSWYPLSWPPALLPASLPGCLQALLLLFLRCLPLAGYLPCGCSTIWSYMLQPHNVRPRGGRQGQERGVRLGSGIRKGRSGGWGGSWVGWAQAAGKACEVGWAKLGISWPAGCQSNGRHEMAASGRAAGAWNRGQDSGRWMRGRVAQHVWVVG